jgi:outer membrane lipoprotein-sorting protein/predicted aspartyl protease
MRIRLFLLPLVITVSSVYCFAQEKAVPEPVLEGLRQQMKQIDTLKAEYTVNGILGQSQKQIKTEVSYIKKGDKYSMSEYAYEGDEQIGETKTVYDGISIKELYFNKKENRNLGTIHSKDMYDVLITSSDIRSLVAGFVFIRKQYEENIINQVFKNMGTESIDGHDCVKIVMISPYLRGQKAYDYLWIEVQNEKYYFLKEVCLIEDDPNQLLYQRKYVFDYSEAYPFPKKIYYERFEIDDKGNRKPYYKLDVAIENFEINAPVAESEFVYSFPEGTLVNGMTASVNPKTITDPNWPNIKTPKNVAELNQPALDNRTKYPIEGGCGAILIPVHIHGKEYSFVLDTGASITILDTSFRDFLGKPKSMQRVQTAGNPMVTQIFESPLIQIGPFVLPQGSEIGCVDLSMFKMVDGREISGTLGMDFLRNHAIMIDFDKNLISFVGKDEIKSSDFEQELEITFNTQGLPQIQGQIGGQIDVDFAIDSGNISAGSLNKTILDKLIEEQHVKTLKSVMITASGSQETREIRVDSLTISNLEYRNLIFGESNYDNLGLEFLDRHTVIMDFPNKKMYLKKGEQFNRKDESGMSGFSLILNSGILTVYSTYKLSPAEKAGIKAGDKIVQIEGKDANNYNMKQLKQLFRSGDRRKINLQIERDGELKEIVITLKREI